MSKYTVSSFIFSVVESYKHKQVNQQSIESHSKSASEIDDLFIFKNDIQTILCDVLNVDKTYLYLNSDKIIEDSLIQEINTKVNRLLEGEPLAYILGYKYFWDQKLLVTQDTLIPRADTEVLVEAVLNDISNKNAKLKILDLGTGTGAIALALASELPNSQVIAIDFSNKALDIAKKNAKENKISNVEFIQSDWYQNLDNMRFDIIVSNPPYIDFCDENITQEVKAYEPQNALFAEDNGLADIKIIISQASLYLNKGGNIYIEHGFTQSKSIQDLLVKYKLSDVKTIKDLNNKDRCTQGKFIN